MSSAPSEITRLLLAWNSGEPAVLDKLMPLVADDLRQAAKRQMKGEARQVTLQPTALVNEVYLKLVEQREVSWQHRAQFFAFAARLMRWILVDHARARLCLKRGVGLNLVPLDEVAEVADVREHDVLVLHEALESLAAFDERQSRVVELRFFAGLSYEEIAEQVGISPRTARREWRAARLWLRHHMHRS